MPKEKCHCVMWIYVGCIRYSLIALFVSFIENDYKNKCIYNYNGNDDNVTTIETNNTNVESSYNEEWFENHPELRLFSRYCKKRIVNMFSDYPCNCRLLSYEQVPSNSLTSSIFESSLINYNNLEGISVESTFNDRDKVKFKKIRNIIDIGK